MAVKKLEERPTLQLTLWVVLLNGHHRPEGQRAGG